MLEVIFRAGGGHAGGGLSAADILAVLYLRVMNINPQRANDPLRDRFVMSKGHCAEALYCALAEAGFVPEDQLAAYGAFGSPLGGHPTRDISGVEISTGALGHGLAVGVGMALAAKMCGHPYRTYVLMGDGEQGEGSIYEAVMAAHRYKLDNLVAIIDRNGLQISGPTEEVMPIEPIVARWESFGWEVLEANGNSIPALLSAFAVFGASTSGKPQLLIANTVKGKGVSFMENVARWHHGVPSTEELAEARKQLTDTETTLLNFTNK